MPRRRRGSADTPRQVLLPDNRVCQQIILIAVQNRDFVVTAGEDKQLLLSFTHKDNIAGLQRQ
ncbi:hypothetical protein J41TS12_32250 [Paenibacillus antibioticophila]|uniref:Uncharacterized protein n=1 Tax=Paenibacillus antibioticophila TaxID=1274374 RepID=A0A920CII7_9BACL|nr:hypothetical protein J41TS12_32250 [Paenibacillus antibioticophila]